MRRLIALPVLLVLVVGVSVGLVAFAWSEPAGAQAQLQADDTTISVDSPDGTIQEIVLGGSGTVEVSGNPDHYHLYEVGMYVQQPDSNEWAFVGYNDEDAGRDGNTIHYADEFTDGHIVAHTAWEADDFTASEPGETERTTLNVKHVADVYYDDGEFQNLLVNDTATVTVEVTHTGNDSGNGSSPGASISSMEVTGTAYTDPEDVPQATGNW